ncbi:MAG TPA: hypothetical protein VHM31_15795 [Polyangia bacterium]|nr:hypothetical protein [Polyangia bacterium]HVY39405.1 hypothetical protein [Polyangia bacterium]
MAPQVVGVSEFMQSRFFAAAGFKLAARGAVTAPHPHPIATARVHRQKIDRMSLTSSCLSHIAAEMPAAPLWSHLRFPALAGSSGRISSDPVT